MVNVHITGNASIAEMAAEAVERMKMPGLSDEIISDFQRDRTLSRHISVIAIFLPSQKRGRQRLSAFRKERLI